RRPRNFFYRVDNVGIAGATTEVADQRAADFVVGQLAICPNELSHVHQNSGTAKSALQSVMVVERLLQRVQLSIDCKPFDRCNRTTVRLHGQHQAGFYCFTVEVHRAGAAYSLERAADVGASEPGDVANEVDQK